MQKKTLPILLALSLLLTGCNFPESEPAPLLEAQTATPGRQNDKIEDPSPTNTVSADPLPSETATTLPVPTTTDLPKQPTPSPRIYLTAQPLTSGALITITRIQMFDPQTGWSVGIQGDSGDHLLFTADGGHTWEDRTPPDPTADQAREKGALLAHFLDLKSAWVIYTPKTKPPALQEKFVWVTRDSGLTWKTSALLESDGMEDTFRPKDFASLGREYGWLLVHVGAGMSHDYSYLYHSKDGGFSWERVTDPFTGGIQSLQNTGMAFADPEYGWVTKDNLGVMPGAFLEQTVDGGYTWEDVFLPSPSDLDWFNDPSLCQTSQPVFLSKQSGLLVVKCRLPEDIQQGVEWSLTYIYRTSDRGDSWEHTRLPSPVDRLLFLDKANGWAFGRDHYRTNDGGRTWEFLKTVFWDGQFSFVDPSHGWAVAQNEEEIALVSTKNGGQSWQIIEALVR